MGGHRGSSLASPHHADVGTASLRLTAHGSRWLTLRRVREGAAAHTSTSASRSFPFSHFCSTSGAQSPTGVSPLPPSMTCRSLRRSSVGG